MKTILLIATLLALPSLAPAQQNNLPLDTLNIISSLHEFEKAELAKARKAISDKRAVVIGLLRSHMEREAKAGKLDAALEIRTTIESLAAADLVKTEPTSRSSIGTDSLNLAGSRWVGGQGKQTKIQFLDNGKLALTVPGANSPWEWNYRVVNDELYLTPNGQPEHKPTLSDNNNKLEIYMMGSFERQP